jgi:hypothetical protein
LRVLGAGDVACDSAIDALVVDLRQEDLQQTTLAALFYIFVG